MTESEKAKAWDIMEKMIERMGSNESLPEFDNLKPVASIILRIMDNCKKLVPMHEIMTR